MEFIRKLQKDGRITIPKPIRDLMNLKPKDKVIFEAKNNKLYLTKSKS